MKDLIIKHTGNSRKIRTSLEEGTTWDAALGLMRSGDFPIDLLGLQDEGVEQLDAGRIISKDGQLYRIVQSVIPQAHQAPGGEGMLAIYRPIDREHAGTEEDPIPWVYGMAVHYP